MTSILTDWGKRCIEKLIKGVIAEARFVFCLSCIANEFDEERAKLQPEMETLEQRVKEAKGRNKNIAANVVSWEEEVVKLFQEDTKTKQNCFFGFCPDCIWRYKRGKKLANDTEKIKGLIEKAEKFGNIEVSRPPPGVERNSLQDYISFESRLSKYNELLDALKDESNFITGLHGMGGTGKTTLAIKVGKELKESGQFTYAIVTTVSSTPDIKKIQDDIAGPLGLELKDFNESDRPGKLWDRLTNGEKILLILDDVWDQNPHPAFDAIGIPNRDNRQGCRVLVTTRSKIMTFDKSIELELLSEDDAWIMFQWYAGISKSSPKYVIDKGCKIAKECKQLPIAIKGIASSLKGKQNRVDEWDVTLKSLKKPVSMQDVDPDKVGIFKCLKVSYDNLKNEKAMKLFLLCSVFQEDEEISIEDLTRISIGAGLFGEDYDTYDDARKDVAVAKNKLLDSCLLLEVRENFVKMHDLIRDVAQWIAGKEIEGVNLSNKNQKSLIEKETNIKCLLFEGSYKDLYFCKFDASKLETLIVIENREENYHRMEIPNSFFENIVKLRVLYLSCYIYGNRSLSLANSIQSLKNIRCMMVQKVDLGDISVLGKLQSLEALDLVKCKIHELPIEIEKLENLKLLRLESCEIGKGNPFEVIKKCSSLEELYFIDSFNDSCQEITLPPKLGRYRIGIRTWRNKIYLSVSKCVVLNKKVYGYFTKGTLEYFMQTAEAIELISIDSGWKNLVPEMVPIKNGMNDVVELHLSFDSELQCLIDTKHIDSQVPIVVFSKLVVLVLFDMEKLEELCNSPISLDCLNNLKKVAIHNCNHLQSLFKCSLNLCNLKKLFIAECSTLISVFDLTSSQSLLQLETLDINYCKKLEKIFTYDGDNGSNSSCNSIMFPNLKEVRVIKCPQLEFVLPLQPVQDLLLLESIMIRSCDKLKYIFGQHQDVQLPSLKELKLLDLPNFIDISPESNHSMPSSIKRSSNSISKTETQLEPIKSNVFSWSHICCHGYKSKGPTSTEISLVSDGQPKDLSISLESSGNVEHFVALERLKVHNSNVESICCLNEVNEREMNTGLQNIELYTLPMMTCLFKGLIKSFSLKNLTKMKIKGCEKLEFVFSTSIIMCLPQLLHIRIEECKELKHMIEDDLENRKTVCFPKLKTVVVENCKMLKNVFPISICKELPELMVLIIREADELEEIFVCEGDQKVNIPNLKFVAFVNLPSLCQTQGIHFQAVQNRFIRSCQELSLTSAITKDASSFSIFNDYWRDRDLRTDLRSIYDQFLKETSDRDTYNENPSSKTTEDIAAGIEVQVASGHMSTSSQELMNQQHSLGGNDNLEGSTSEKPVAEPLSTISTTENEPPIQVTDHKQKGIMITNEEGTALTNTKTISKQITTSQEQSTQEGSTSGTKNDQDIQLDPHETAQTNNDQESKGCDNGNENPSVETTEDFDVGSKVQAASSGHEITSSQLEGSRSEKTAAETKNESTTHLVSPKLKDIKKTAEKGSTSTNAKTITSSTHLELELMDEESMDEQCMMSPQNSVGEIDATIKPSQGVKEVADGKIRIPSFSIVNTEPPPTKDVDIGDSQKTIAMEDINKLIEEDPLLALEKLLAGQVSISSIRILLQELKSLMDSSSDLHHLISNQESKSKLICLFNQLNQHQGLLPSHVKEFIEKVQTFFIDNFIKYATFQQVLKKHNQLLDSKTDLVNKLWSAYSTQTNIDHEISTANAQIEELALQIDEHTKKLEDIENQRDDLKSVVNRFNVQKNKLKAECTEWAQQSKELLSALASSEVDVREAERTRNLATEGFANLKSSFPTF